MAQIDKNNDERLAQVKAKKVARKHQELEQKKLEEELKRKIQQAAAAGLNVTFEIERSVLGTPEGEASNPNVTVDIERSPQSYCIPSKGSDKNLEDYGMDQNSDDSDETAPKKPIPS
uniref:inner centromere protein-like n=1 Tax=Monopterus albus TaxID=43700 RepID=UPI0009B3CF0A|nr:inner centromere protein-like [Monopterus albus]